MALTANQRIIVSHNDAVAQVRWRVSNYAKTNWSKLGSYYPADIDRFVNAVVPVIESGQKQIWQLSNAYLDAIIREKGLAPKVATVAKNYTELRGIAAQEVYGRPGITTRMAISEGRPILEAADLGAKRLYQIVQSDMQIANSRAAYSRTSADDRMVGYRRVITSGNPCALCLIASTQRYRREDLMPIHSSCSCDVEPIFGTEDRHVIDQELLDATYSKLDEMGLDVSTGSEKLVSVNFHGEMGPVLTHAGHHFKGPDDF